MKNNKILSLWQDLFRFSVSDVTELVLGANADYPINRLPWKTVTGTHIGTYCLAFNIIVHERCAVYVCVGPPESMPEIRAVCI